MASVSNFEKHTEERPKKGLEKMAQKRTEKGLKGVQTNLMLLNCHPGRQHPRQRLEGKKRGYLTDPELASFIPKLKQTKHVNLQLMQV